MYLLKENKFWVWILSRQDMTWSMSRIREFMVLTCLFSQKPYEYPISHLIINFLGLLIITFLIMLLWFSEWLHSQLTLMCWRKWQYAQQYWNQLRGFQECSLLRSQPNKKKTDPLLYFHVACFYIPKHTRQALIQLISQCRM